ncbi:MAG: hypothetical protein ABL890_03345 [Candidatus Peribacteraceae bacterium]
MTSLPEAAVAPTKAGFLPVLERLGLPTFLFGIVFLLLTTGVTFLLTPDRFPVHVGGKVIRLADLAAEEQRLQDELDQLNQNREELVKSQDNAPILSQVYARRAEMLPIGTTLLSVESLRSSFRTTTIDPIAIPGVTFDSVTRSLVLRGRVTDPTGGSNHILASFVDGLRTLTTVSTVSEPEYIQEQTPEGMSTPFTITIRFADAT